MKFNLETDCRDIVVEMLGEENATKWWSEPNKSFDGLAPYDVLTSNPWCVYDFLLDIIQSNY